MADEPQVQPAGKKDAPGAEPYPAVDRTDSIKGDADEARSFEPKAAPSPRKDDDIPHATAEGWLGPGGDPAEGKPY